MRFVSCLLLLSIGIVRVAAATPYTRISLERVHAGDHDQFGFAVGSIGSYVIVGAPGESFDGGAAYLFDGKTGALVREFRRADGSAGDRFGAAVAGEGSRVLIGAPGYNQNLGTTYVYDLTIAGDQGTALAHSGGQFGDFFGSSVGVAAGGLLAGAPRFKTSVNADRAGRVYRYNEELGESFSLLRPIARQQVEFGYAIAGTGNTIVVGAPFDNQGQAGPKNGGAIYLYDATDGAYLATIFQPVPTKEDKFGFSVANFGDRFLVGAPRDGDQRTGEAYIYDPTDTVAPQHILNKPAATRGDEFGNAVTRVGANVLIGARGDDDLAHDSGAAYLFDGNGAWLETFSNPTPKRDDHFAWSVGAAGTNFVVGAPDDDEDGTDAGKAYLYVDFVPDPGSCDDDDVCTLDEGTVADGCGHLAIAGCCNEDIECSDGDQCNDVNRCENHECVASDPGCSDGIACTLDCSPATGCITPQAPPGFPGLLCWLGALRDAMKTDLPGARGFSARLVSLSATTYQRGEVAGSAPSRRAIKILKRIKKRLRRIDAVVTRVERRKKLDAAVAKHLRGYSKNARETLPALVIGLRF